MCGSISPLHLVIYKKQRLIDLWLWAGCLILFTSMISPTTKIVNITLQHLMCNFLLHPKMFPLLLSLLQLLSSYGPNVLVMLLSLFWCICPFCQTCCFQTNLIMIFVLWLNNNVNLFLPVIFMHFLLLS